MRIVIFGTGFFYTKRRKELNKIRGLEIVAFIDNDSKKWGTRIDNILITSPNHIYGIDYDIVLVMSLHVKEMKKQLFELGISKQKIKFWEEFKAEVSHEQMIVLNPMDFVKEGKGKILILSSALDYTGGPMTAVYAAKVLKKVGYYVVLAAPSGDNKFIKEIILNNLSVVICPVIPYLQKEELNWIRQFDVVMVNVFPMIKCAIDVSNFRPTFWWIHEAKSSYEIPISYFDELISNHKIKNINVYAVSKIAKGNFNTYFPKKIKKILNYGIPDMYSSYNHIKGSRHSKTVFAIIGYVSELKAQDIFVKAIKEIEYNDSVEFWIIGLIGNDEYSNSIRTAAEENSSIKILGLLTREEIYRKFSEIDVVVCPSREDCLPIVMAEAMMFEKVCIASEGTGTADFIKEGENGFIVPVEDVHALSKRMRWIIENKNDLEYIRKNSRKTYEKYFSMEVFADNLEKALLETVKVWKKDKNI